MWRSGRDPGCDVCDLSRRVRGEPFDLRGERVEPDRLQLIPELEPAAVDAATRSHVHDEHWILAECSFPNEEPSKLRAFDHSRRLHRSNLTGATIVEQPLHADAVTG